MAGTASQHRCVFVGNIPYDATEEQLVQICEEVGPVVSFRLVIDRETGKPKGYGFCEYKDEETALSARRNLQGYEINGRQLRVDFAENDKGVDRNREQGRGGPGLPASVDSQKQVGGPAVIGDLANQQPIGLSAAMTAASVMTRALGGAQTGINSNQNGVPGSDPLTLHLAHMPRNQLYDVLSELKLLATQNKESARNLMLGSPLLMKALFQALIMLGLVNPQLSPMLNNQDSVSIPPPVVQDDQQAQQPLYPGLPPIAQNKVHTGVMPSSMVPQNFLVANQLLAPRHLPPAVKNPSQQTAFPGQSGVPTLPSMRVQPFPSVSAAVSSSSLKQPTPHSLLQHPGQMVSMPQQEIELSNVTATVQHSLSTRPSIQDPRLQGSGKLARIGDSSDITNRPSKLMKLDDGTSASAPEPLGPDVESALLQQVMNLTPEQISSLPLEQQQQVIQLQRMYR